MLRQLLTAGGVAALLCAGSAGGAAEPTVLQPSGEGQVRGSAAWLVVAAPEAPVVTLDGHPAELTRSADSVHHVRLIGIVESGSQVRIRAAGRTLELEIRASGAAASGFHGQAPQSCWDCHGAGEDGCMECHPWRGSRHRPVAAGACLECHVAPRWEPLPVAPVCAGCHPAYKDGKHPRLRHPVAAARDPLRPGRRLDCASCHDPHRPRCLSCLGRAELRAWCKDCHRPGG